MYSKDNPLLMIPGPVDSRENVLEATAARSYSHTEPAFVGTFQETLQNLRKIFDVSHSFSPLVVAGGGTLAMEIAMLNLMDTSKEQKGLICKTGYFGDRFATLADRLGMDYSTLTSQTGHKIREKNLSEALDKEDFDFAFIQHVDTSTGVANDVELFGKLCEENDVISVVDGVCALGGQELHQEAWNIDIYLTGAQKALAVPPGLAIMMYSSRAREISESRNEKVPSYYADLENWWPIMDAYLDGQASYYSTPATNLITGLHQSTENLLSETMDKVYSRHQRLADKLRSSLSNLGFDFITAEGSRASTLSTPKYLDGMDGDKFREEVLDLGVLLAGGIQSGISGTYFRVGHMGNITDIQVEYTIEAIENSIN